MKFLDKVTLVLFSVIVLVVSVVLALLLFGFVSFSKILILYNDLIGNPTATNVAIGVSIVCALLAIRAIFFGGSKSETEGDGVLLQNENGKLLISRDTIENLVNGVAKSFDNTQSVATRVIINSENELMVFVTLMVLPNTIINELSMNLQNRIKEVVKSATNLDIKSIDIRIKNITTPEEKKEV